MNKLKAKDKDVNLKKKAIINKKSSMFSSFNLVWYLLKIINVIAFLIIKQHAYIYFLFFYNNHKMNMTTLSLKNDFVVTLDYIFTNLYYFMADLYQNRSMN